MHLLVHVFTGCDSVSGFAGKGKAKALKMLKDDAEVHSSDLVKKGNCHLISWYIQKFPCELYSSGTTEFNIARYNLFCPKNVRQNPSNCHHVKSANRNIFPGQTVKHKSGSDVFNSIQ